MTPCDHLKADTWPLQVEHAFTVLVTFADALVRCSQCQRQYLLELLDVRAHERLYRISLADSGLAAGLLHNLNRGSCDLARADAEFANFRHHCEQLEMLLWVDGKGPTLSGLVPVDAPLPQDSWQTLTCDGAWFKKLNLPS